MMRVYTDFQSVGPNGSVWILEINGGSINDQAEVLGIKEGDRVILDAHEDFEVIGVLGFGYVDVLDREVWIAYPDWLTKRPNSRLP